MYEGKLPVVVTGMKQLQEHGSAGAVFRRFGRPQNQMLIEAIVEARALCGSPPSFERRTAAVSGGLPKPFRRFASPFQSCAQDVDAGDQRLQNIVTKGLQDIYSKTMARLSLN
ncbi:hypothetical protein [Streptomyces sp. col6]|uniref:hypothetical protein n=1 Tax=Streptomyces sp. col6 TaxID=2478958 RepID=UPI001747AFF3|nr:hypothetical protein [Streptomyces sp. col6]